MERIVRHMDWGEQTAVSRATNLIKDGCVGAKLIVRAKDSNTTHMLTALVAMCSLYDKIKDSMRSEGDLNMLASVKLEYDYPVNAPYGEIESQEFMAP